MQLLGWILIEVNFSNSNGTIDENTKSLAKSILFNHVTGCINFGCKLEIKKLAFSEIRQTSHWLAHVILT